MPSPFFPVTLALYAAACVLYLSHLGAPEARASSLARTARAVLGAAFLSHAVDIGYLCLRGVHPFVNARETLSFIAWLTVGAYLGLTLRHRIPTVGALIVPITIVLDVAARAAPQSHAPGHAETLLLTLHIGLAAAGVAVFAVAAGDAAIYLATEAQLKRHRVGAMFKKAPPLETLDRINRACILLGFPLFTVAMVMGALIAMRAPGGGAHRLLQPEYLMSALTWVLYAALLVARVTAGWRGRRAALVTLAGFTAACGVLAVYYTHSFQGA